MMKVNPRERQILKELDFIRRTPDQSTRGDGYCRCMDIGGTDASYHSVVLLRLEKKGLVERRRYRKSSHWRITAAGTAAIALPQTSTESQSYIDGEG